VSPAPAAQSAPAAPAAPTAQPDQPATAPAEPSRIGRVISIVRWLIAYGTLLATAVREHPAEPLARTIVYWFQTPDLGVILGRLTRGLMRAAALEAWLLERAASGHELRDPSTLVPSLGNPRSGPPAAPSGAPPALNLRAGRGHRGVTRTGPATAGPAVAIRYRRMRDPRHWAVVRRSRLPGRGSVSAPRE
jgi:hypothetical protein